MNECLLLLLAAPGIDIEAGRLDHE